MNATTDKRSASATRREAEIRRMLAETLRAAASRIGARKVVLFGSRARGDASDRSDFDLGVLGDQPMPLEDFYAVEDMIDALPTLYRLDWVDLTRVSPKFRASALENVEVLYEG